MRAGRGPGWPVLLLAVVALVARLATGSGDPDCPFQYERHTLHEIVAGTKRPWLYDGAFHNFGSIEKPRGRICVNCHRGGLWPTFCGRRRTGQEQWDLQLCGDATADAALALATDHDDLRGALTLTPCDLYRQLRGRTLWVIGDSISKDLIKAFKCFMIEFWDLKQYHLTNNYTAMAALHALPGFGEPRCIHMPGYTRLCMIHAIQGDLFVNTTRAVSGVLPLIANSRLSAPDDVFVLNFGLWHGDVQRERYNRHLREVGAFWRDHKKTMPHMFWMETPKQHFAKAADGDFQVSWLTDKKRVKGNHTCGPVPGVGYRKDGSLSAAEGDAVAAAVAGGTWRNADARAVLGGEYGMPLVPIFNMTATAWDMHRKNFAGTECSHFCHPSMPQLWLWALHTALDRGGVQPLPPPKGPVRERNACAQVLEQGEAQLGAPKSAATVLAEAAAARPRRPASGVWEWLFGRR
ncbi:MAG: hypothetical protein J3K34DRAFT_402088 [Monoraphidium minutum]|nr:MAG: hypothetical protein J3K34DRAFT_402088 [Monoraphidium minutum]